MIESDIAEQGRGPIVRFYSRPVKNEYESAEQSRPIYADIDYIEIKIPGDQTLIIDTPVRPDHITRFPVDYARYKNAHGNDAKSSGTPLSQWPMISAAQAEELRGLKFYTVESVANASDQQITNIGMAGGMAPFTFRDRARRYLEVAQGDSTNNKQAEELAALKQAQEEKDAAHKAELAKMQDQINSILAGQATPKGKPGRKAKPKPEESQEVQP